MSLVVVDAGPLHYLLLLGRESLLSRIFNDVIIPEAVLSELKHSSTPALVRTWVDALPEWATVRKAGRLLATDTLDAGELEAISIAAELNATVLLDERKARAFAKASGLSVIGTIGVLDFASARGWIVIEEDLQKLQATNIRLAASLIEDALARSRRPDKNGQDAS